MPDILRREFAPLSESAWKAIDAEAKRTIELNLSGRKVVDFCGPFGWEFAAVNIGRLDVREKKADVPWGIRQVQPLVETRIPFRMNQMELDSIDRGSLDFDVQPIQNAATKAALFEDNAVFNGFDTGCIDGILKSSEHKPLKLPADIKQYPTAVAQAITELTRADISGPYNLVLAPNAFVTLMGTAAQGYPVYKQVQDILGGKILLSRALAGGVVMSARGGDFELTVGQDFSLGYTIHDSQNVELFVTESFTFRVIEPKAAIELKAAGK